jgi:hypothetical protein
MSATYVVLKIDGLTESLGFRSRFAVSERKLYSCLKQQRKREAKEIAFLIEFACPIFKPLGVFSLGSTT